MSHYIPLDIIYSSCKERKPRVTNEEKKIRDSQLPYRQCNLPSHSVNSTKVRISEKIYIIQETIICLVPIVENVKNIEFEQLGTAVTYGCNYYIDGIGKPNQPSMPVSECCDSVWPEQLETSKSWLKGM